MSELLETLKGWDFLLINDSEARLLSGEKQSEARRPQNPRTWGRAPWLSSAASMARCCSERISTSSFPATCSKRSSIRQAQAIVLPAASSAPWRPCGFDLKDPKIDRKELARAVIYGSVMGSFCCEKFGVERFRTLTRAEIDARYQEFKSFTRLLKSPTAEPNAGPSMAVRGDCRFAAADYRAYSPRRGITRKGTTLLRRRRVAPGHGTANRRQPHAGVQPDRQPVVTASSCTDAALRGRARDVAIRDGRHDSRAWPVLSWQVPAVRRRTARAWAASPPAWQLRCFLR